MYHTSTCLVMETRESLEEFCSKARERKKRQLSTMEGKKKHEESRKRSHHKKIIEDQLLRDELSQLRKKSVHYTKEIGCFTLETKAEEGGNILFARGIGDV